MRLSYLIVPLIAATLSSCGGSSEPTTPLPKHDPPPSVPSVAGTWSGTLNYRFCEESDGFGVCASLHTPKATTFQMTIVQTSETHVEGGLTVATVTGTISFDGLSGHLRGIIDEAGSIFFDDDNFVAPILPNHTARIRNWVGQLDNPPTSMFGYFRMFIDVDGGAPGQAIVTGNMTDGVRVSR